MDAGTHNLRERPSPGRRLKEFVMRYYPAALALSLLLGVTASMGSAKGGDPVDPRAQALLQSGRSLLAQGQVSAATDEFEAALAVDPGYVGTYLALAEAARRDGLQGKAIHYYRVALSRDPNNLAAISGEGGALVEKGAVEKARLNLTRLEGLCGKRCSETLTLSAAIAKGPQPKVLSAEAVKPEPTVEAN
jgi:tetratricopeptide (TPR) repeat protein